MSKKQTQEPLRGMPLLRLFIAPAATEWLLVVFHSYKNRPKRLNTNRTRLIEEVGIRFALPFSNTKRHLTKSALLHITLTSLESENEIFKRLWFTRESTAA